MTESETLGQRLIRLRTMARLQPSGVAKRIKITTREYSLLEEGRDVPDYFVLYKLMKLYGCTSDYLLYGIMVGLRQDLFEKFTRFLTKDEEEALINAIESDEDNWKSEGGLK